MESSVAYVYACVCIAAWNSLASVVVLCRFLDWSWFGSCQRTLLKRFLPELTDQSEEKDEDERTEADGTFTLILRGEG